MDKDIISCLREFIENETKSCSMDFRRITPEYIYRMWGGKVPIEDIKVALTEIKNKSL